MQSLATEMEAMKLFIKEQFYLLKKSISEINSNTDTTDNSITETTDLLRKHIEFLLQENASKNTIIKILAENQQHASNTKEVVSSESFKTVKGTFLKNRYKPKPQNVCSNRYDTFTQQITVTNQIPLVMQKLCRQEALHQILVITQTVKRRKDNTKSGKLIIRQQVKY